MQYETDWKYRIPRLHNVLRRQKVAQYLEDRAERKLVLVRARAGQGKTTVMADFLKQKGYRNSWVRLTEVHSAPEEFLRELHDVVVSLLQNGDPSGGPEGAGKDVDELIERLHLIGGAPTYIVLDDFEHIGLSPEIGGIIEQIVDRMPENLRIAILTREMPDMALARIRLLQNLVEVTDEDLSFCADECLELFRDVFHLEISRETASRIVDRAGGWVTGIILLIDQMSNLEDDEDARGLIDSFLTDHVHRDYVYFFDEEVLNSAEPDVVSVLVKLGGFPVITRELAEDLLGSSAAEHLENAYEQGLFISPYDATVKRWDINPLFADYLSSQFDLLPPEQQERLLKTGAGRYVQQGMIEQALITFIRGGIFEEARQLFIEYAEVLIRENKLLKISDLLSVFPEMMRKKDQYLEFYGLIADNLYHPESTKRKLFRLLPFFESRNDSNRQATIYSILLQNYFFYQENRDAVDTVSRMTEAFLQRPHQSLDDQKRQLLEALIPLANDWETSGSDEVFDAVLRAEETSLQLHNSEAFLCSRLVLARKYVNRGDFKAGSNLLTQTLSSFGDDRYGRPYASLTCFYLGDVLFYQGDVHAALRQVQEGLDNATPEFGFRTYLEINLILYTLYLKKYQNAEILFDGIRDRDMGDNLYLRYFRGYQLQMLIAYRTGNHRRASYYCKRLLDPENEVLLNTDRPFSLLSLLEVGIWIDDESIVESVLQRLEDEVDPDLHPYPAATAFALRAVHHRRKGREARAAGMAAKALKILKAHNFTNIDICDPEMLHEFSQLLDGNPTESFPRLRSLVTTNRFMEKESQLEIHTLGSFRIFAGGNEIPINRLISQKRVMDLLKLLIIFRKNGVIKEMVYDPFWPKYSLKNARDNLNTIFYRLRNILGKDNDFFVANATRISFKEGVLSTDVDRFLDFSRLGEEAEGRHETGNAIDLYNHAADTYGGDFLAGDMYSDFIRDERHMLQRRYVGILFRLAKLHLDSGDYLQALDCLKKLLDQDPVCEPAVRLLMIASAQVGSRNSIPQIYGELGDRLLKIYNLGPDEMTEQLKNTLLSGMKPEPSMWKNEVFIN